MGMIDYCPDLRRRIWLECWTCWRPVLLWKDKTAIFTVEMAIETQVLCSIYTLVLRTWYYPGEP